MREEVVEGVREWREWRGCIRMRLDRIPVFSGGDLESCWMVFNSNQ